MTTLINNGRFAGMAGAVALLALGITAEAHHSFQATFRSDAKITVEGVVDATTIGVVVSAAVELGGDGEVSGDGVDTNRNCNGIVTIYVGLSLSFDPKLGIFASRQHTISTHLFKETCHATMSSSSSSYLLTFSLINNTNLPEQHWPPPSQHLPKKAILLAWKKYLFALLAYSTPIYPSKYTKQTARHYHRHTYTTKNPIKC